MASRLFISVAVVCGLLNTAAYGMSGNPLDDLYQLKEGESRRSSSCDANWKDGNGDARPIPAGATLTIADLKGPGVITHFWNTIAAEDSGYPRLLVLRVYWDGEQNPSIECPIGDFFGIGHGLDVPYQSLPITVTSDGRARNCYWPMPFRKSARMTVTNEGQKRVAAFYYYVDWRKLPKLRKDTAYFHAMYRQEFPTVSGRNYLIADIEGRGHYVGTVQSVRQRTGAWWGEGDDFFFIDGETEPSLRGTGSEDYYCDAWGLRKMSNIYYGAPVMEGYHPYAHTCVYRWHIADPVIFNKSLHVEIEHKGVTFKDDGTVKSGFEERADDFASVAFWYQIEPHKPFPALPPAADRLFKDHVSRIEAESLVGNAKASSGGVTKQDGDWCGGAQLFWQPGEANQTLDVPFEITGAAKTGLIVLLTHSPDYGIVQLELDGKPAGEPIDLFCPQTVTREHRVPATDLPAGPHTIRMRSTGKNPDSKGFFFGVDAIMFDE